QHAGDDPEWHQRRGDAGQPEVTHEAEHAAVATAPGSTSCATSARPASPRGCRHPGPQPPRRDRHRCRRSAGTSREQRQRTVTPAEPELVGTLPRTIAPLDEASASKRSRRSLGPVATAAAVVTLLLILVAVFAPLLAPYAPNAGRTADRLKGMGVGGHLLGT